MWRDGAVDVGGSTARSRRRRAGGRQKSQASRRARMTPHAQRFCRRSRKTRSSFEQRSSAQADENWCRPRTTGKNAISPVSVHPDHAGMPVTLPRKSDGNMRCDGSDVVWLLQPSDEKSAVDERGRVHGAPELSPLKKRLVGEKMRVDYRTTSERRRYRNSRRKWTRLRRQDKKQRCCCAHFDADRAAAEIERAGSTLTPQALATFAQQARKRMRDANGGYRRDHLRARPAGSSDRPQERAPALACAASGEKSAFPVLFRSGAPKGFEPSDNAPDTLQSSTSR